MKIENKVLTYLLLFSIDLKGLSKLHIFVTISIHWSYPNLAVQIRLCSLQVIFGKQLKPQLALMRL